MLYSRSNLTCIHSDQETDKCPECFSDLYNEIAKNVFNQTCPLVEKEIIIKDNAPWFNEDIRRAK